MIADIVTKTRLASMNACPDPGEAELDEWLATLPRKERFMLAMSVSALSLEKGQCRSRDDLVCFLTAAGLPASRQSIEDIELRALRKCRRTGLAMVAKEHLTTR